MAIKNKKAFAFSFISLFLVILIYYYANLQFGNDTFTSKTLISQNRIETINQEIIYFENNYLVDVFEVATYKTIDSLINNSINNSFYNTYSSNYSKFNSLIYEGVTNGSFNGVQINSLDGYTINNLTQNFLNHLENNYFVLSNYSASNFIVYEENPFSIVIQGDFNFEFKSQDNLASWSFDKTLISNINLYGQFEPYYFIIGKLNYTSPEIDSVEQYSANLNWTQDLFNDTIDNELANIYYEPNYKYTIGGSFLGNLFNKTYGSYKNILGFWSFDYDYEENQIYDSSQNNFNSSFYGDARFISSLENHTLIRDQTSFKNSVTISGSPLNDSNCIWFNCLSFDGVNDFISIDNSKGFDKEFSFSIWFNSSSNLGNKTLISLRDNLFTNGIEIYLESNNSINFDFSCNSNLISYNLPINVSNSRFNSLIGGVSLITNETYLYLNGLNLLTQDFSHSCTSLNFNEDINIGRNSFSPYNYFQGNIDEISFFSKKLSLSEISNLYYLVEAKEINYLDSFHDTAIEFNGKSFVNLSLNPSIQNFNNDNFSIGIWFNPYSNNYNLFTFESELSVGVNNSRLIISSNDGNSITLSNFIPVKNHFNYLLLSKSNSGIDLYLNDKKTSIPLLTSDLDGGLLTLGSESYPSSDISNQNFTGLIDEFFILNKFSNNFDFEKQYYNFKSEMKGCCNYIIPLNPNKHSFNTLSFSDNTSYSSNLFFNYYFKNISYDITLYSVDNLTSDLPLENYYNLLFDQCMLDTYDIYSYDNGDNINLIYEGANNFSCSQMIKMGIY